MSIGVPKPPKRGESEKRVEQLTKAWARKDRWRTKAIAKAKGKPRPKVRERNEKRIARKAKAYRAVIASAFHKWLRYEAELRSNGLCECEECKELRSMDSSAAILEGRGERWLRARTPIGVWFTHGGAAPHKRFRSNEGEVHHLTYKFFGDENPAELQQVIWVWKECHRRIEAERGTRRRFLSGRK